MRTTSKWKKKYSLEFERKNEINFQLPNQKRNANL